ncbi:hypothetical protein MNB_SV-13-1966 [hydrothermal vent metagenome]|uniref:Uncharacterized protein n=1 Tax=hydrothermal vent metagenome TaxID=652676 RepID=A0A1W1CXD7_9ZZZZ
MKFIKMIIVIFISGLAIYILPPLYFYLEKNPENFYSIIDKSDRIVITYKNIDKEILYESQNIEEIQSFKSVLHFDKQVEFFLPSCRGKVGISFYSKDKRLVRMAYLSNSHVRINGIRELGYIGIKHNDLLEEWFSDRNITMFKK